MQHAVFYHWKVKEGREEDFARAWGEVTKDGKDRCGSKGAILHRCDDGTFAAYALWPDKTSREECWLGDASQTEAARTLVDCTETKLAEVLMDVADDRLG